MSDQEHGRCAFCKKEGPITRTYLHGCDQKDGEYDGFIIIWHCHDHTPRELAKKDKEMAEAYDDGYEDGYRTSLKRIKELEERLDKFRGINTD